MRDRVRGILCGEDGICELDVLDGEVDCSGHGGPGSLVASSPAAALVILDHVLEGCCPEFSAVAVANLRCMEIEVDYSLTHDVCDCVWQLDVNYRLEGIPAGSYGLIAAGSSTKVEVE